MPEARTTPRAIVSNPCSFLLGEINQGSRGRNSSRRRDSARTRQAFRKRRKVLDARSPVFGQGARETRAEL